MESNALFLIEFLLFAGLALGWGFWQLWCLRRDRLSDEQRQQQPEQSEKTPRHSEGQ